MTGQLITVRLPAALIARLDAEATRRVVHRALIINAALTEWLDAPGDGWDAPGEQW